MPTLEMPDDVRARLEELSAASRTQQAASQRMPEDVARRTGQQLTPSRGFLQSADDLARMAAQGGSFGYADEISAGVNAALGAGRDYFNPPQPGDAATNQPRGFSARYDANLTEERRRDAEARAAHPWLAPIAEIVGGVASGSSLARALPRVFGASRVAPLARRTLEGVRGGTVGGAIGGFGSGEGSLENRLLSAGQGAVMGGAIGSAIPVVARAIDAVATPIFNVLGWRNAPQAAREQLLRAFERDGISLADAERRLTQWQVSGARPETILDLGGENVRALGQQVVNMPGASRTAGRAAYEERTVGRPPEVDPATGQTTRPGAPSQSERVLEDVRQLGGGATGRQFYPELDALDQARRTAAAPLYERAYAQDFVANDTINSILQTPAGRAAANRARVIAMNERRDPNALGLNVNAAGDVVFERAPSMQTLDYIKRGMDDIIEQFRNPITNRLRLDEGGAAINRLRGELVAELRARNPVYGEALDAWAGPSRMRDAMELGRDILGRDQELNAAAVRRMPDSEREAFRLGAIRAITDRIRDTADGGNVVRRFFATPNQVSRIEAAFDDPAAFARFRVAMDREAAMVPVNRFMDPRAGSPTHRLGQQAAEQGVDVPGVVSSVLQGEVGQARRGLVRGMFNRAQGLGAQGSEALAPLLFQTTEAGNRGALGILQSEAARRAFAERQAQDALRGTIFGGTAGAAGTVPTMPFYSGQ